jgi:hypothetical protein
LKSIERFEVEDSSSPSSEDAMEKASSQPTIMENLRPEADLLGGARMVSLDSCINTESLGAGIRLELRDLIASRFPCFGPFVLDLQMLDLLEQTLVLEERREITLLPQLLDKIYRSDVVFKRRSWSSNVVVARLTS